MPEYRYDHIHLRSPDPNATARFFETMFGVELVSAETDPRKEIPPAERAMTSTGRLCHGGGGHEWGDRRRRAFM
jgi:catechol 2,3-dioxygenase-like lactoylglutathione lyase family enzyme